MKKFTALDHWLRSSAIFYVELITKTKHVRQYRMQYAISLRKLSNIVIIHQQIKNINMNQFALAHFIILHTYVWQKQWEIFNQM